VAGRTEFIDVRSTSSGRVVAVCNHEPMKRRDLSLIEQIERTALAADADLAPALRACVLLGGRAGSVDLRDWASRELRGYEGVDASDLPSYRTVGAGIYIDGVTFHARIAGERISPNQLPDAMAEKVDERIEIRHALGELEDIVRTRRNKEEEFIRMSLPMGRDIARLMTYEMGDETRAVQDVYWNVHVSTLTGVVDAVRTALTELVAELRAGMPDTDEIPSAELASQAVQVAVTGHRPRVTVQAPQSEGGGTSTATLHEPREGRGWKFWAAITGAASLVGVVLGWLTL